MRIERGFALGVATLGALGVLLNGRGVAQAPVDVFDVKAHYAKAEHMIPMRDGVKLYTIVYRPRDTGARYPFLLVRTPYSIPPYGPDEYRRQLGPSVEFDREGFIFVFQDVRGKFRSDGEFTVMRPHQPVKKTPSDTDESSDTYDTIEWLLQNVPEGNGRVGQWGISYPGFQTVMGMIDAHPALKASSPQASPSDMFVGDDFHHNGAFRLMYTFSWLSGNARQRRGPTEAREGPFDYGTPDGYKFFLEVGPIANINERYFQYRVPTWNEYMEHGTYDDYWRRQNVLPHLRNVRHPVLNVAGWFDAEDFYGPMSIYYAIEKNDKTNQSTILVGPWLHGGWNSMEGDALGNLRFGSKTSRYFREEIQLPFFNYYLKDKGSYTPAEAVVFETGRNVWRRYDEWPPRASEPEALYLRAARRLSFDRPTENSVDAYDAYESDPAKPVPWSAETRTTQGHLWMVEDQRFAARRPDVLSYQTEPLTEPVTICGPIVAKLHVSTTGTDSDWVVKMIDVFPGDAPDNDPNPAGVRMGDFQMLLAGEVFRGKFRTGFDHPTPMVSGRVTPIEIDLRDRYHTFLPRHRIMVQVQSSWFPVIDRNPQTFVDVYHASEKDFRKATQKIYRSAADPSHLTFNVLRQARSPSSH